MDEYIPLQTTVCGDIVFHTPDALQEFDTLHGICPAQRELCPDRKKPAFGLAFLLSGVLALLDHGRVFTSRLL